MPLNWISEAELTPSLNFYFSLFQVSLRQHVNVGRRSFQNIVIAFISSQVEKIFRLA